ncbi:hypothetical protein RRF57_012226 [Xylaria bambusicola]|uniref:Uncharacterized protein n=1 Tax=Xylaria bambusicola TaxID=326684 RepID=A0AAN7V5E6_9PEZI
MLASLARHRASSLAAAGPKTGRRPLSTTTVLRSTPSRTPSFNSGFTSSYDPNDEGGSGPMFNKTTIGVPQFYPRDLKKRVDEYVVGQDRAKKTISSVIFNHYQNLRRRQYQEEQERQRDEKLMRQAVARDRNIRERELYSVEVGVILALRCIHSILTIMPKTIIQATMIRCRLCDRHGHAPSKTTPSFTFPKI